jgi:hypothetical protein
MSILGLTDPWNIMAYVGCFICVAFCVVYGLMKGREDDSEEDERWPLKASIPRYSRS